MIGAVALVAAVLALGTRLARRVLRPDAPRLLVGGMGAVLGAATAGIAAVLVALAGVPVARPLAWALALAAGAGAWALGPTARPTTAWGRPRPRSPADGWALGVLALFGLLLVTTVITTPLVSVDARTLWVPHARLIADTGRYPAPELRDPAFVIAHASYPPLLPIMEALVGVAAGSVDERVLRAVPTAFYFAVGALLLVELPRREPRWGVLLAAAWGLLPALVVFEEGGADAGLADVALSALVLASALLFERAEAGQAPFGAAVLAGVLAAAAALTKNEGLVLGGLLCLSAAVGDRAGRIGRLRRAGLATLAFVLLIGPWLAVRSSLRPILDEGYFGHLRWDRLLAAAPRAGNVAAEMLAQIFVLPHRSGLFWWLVVGWFLASPRKADALRAGRLAVVPVYVLVVYVLYVVTPWEGVIQVQLSFSRVLLQVAPLALWAVARDAAAPSGPETARG